MILYDFKAVFLRMLQLNFKEIVLKKMWKCKFLEREVSVIYIYIYIYIYIREAYDKFPDFFRMSTFIDSTHMKL